MKGICSLLKIDFDFASFWRHLGVDFGSLLPPQMPPFGHPFRAQNQSKNRSEIGLLKKSLQDRPKTAQDPPKTPPGLPQDPPRCLPDPPGHLQNAPRRPPKASRAPLGPYQKSKTSKSSKNVEKKKPTVFMHTISAEHVRATSPPGSAPWYPLCGLNKYF